MKWKFEANGTGKKCTGYFSGNLRGRTHLEDGGKDRMLHIINVLGLGRAKSLKIKLLMGLLYIQTRNVMND
jgi:hypothetical protein